MSLLARVVERLDDAGIRCALVGAEALAVRGSSRATADRDLLTTDRRVLDAETWAPLASTGIAVEIRRADPEDPLGGVVRFSTEGERPVDLIVGRHAWQSRIVERAEVLQLGDARVAVPATADLVLLKLYAGGPQDAWDVAQLLVGADRAALVAEVERRSEDLPADARRLWRTIVEG
jgi:hypothetical protein